LCVVYSLEFGNLRFFADVDLDAARSCPVGIACSRKGQFSRADIAAASGWCIRSFLVAKGSGQLAEVGGRITGTERSSLTVEVELRAEDLLPGTLGLLFLVLIFSDDYDVGLDLGVFVECGFALPPAAVELGVFGQRELGLSHKKSPRRPILRF
jgi:hypothetical protein